MRKTAVLVMSLGALAAAAPPAPAQDLDTALAGLEQYPKARTRGADQLAHPDFMARSARMYPAMVADTMLVNVDPYRLGWSRGESRDVRIRNRYGTDLVGRLYAPEHPRADLPAVIALTGGAGPIEAQEAFTQGLAEAGYMVLAVEAPGDGHTPGAPVDPVPETPENEYCRPGNFGDWQAPQEMGIAERQACAGGYQPPPAGAPDAAGLAQLIVKSTADAVLVGHPPWEEITELYEQVKARKVFAALDAAKWLTSTANPWRSRLDADRIGIAGHSLGAHAALVAGNGDPLRRFDAVVSWDGFGRLAPSATPRTPTLFFHHEIDAGYPKHSVIRTEEIAGYQDLAAFTAARVPAMLVVPDASTHADFTFINYPPTWVGAATVGGCPDCVPAMNSTRDGERVALHYTQAWFDRWLKPSRRSRDDARRRLLTRTFPESADASSIGQGRWEPDTQSNRPYEIGGESVTSHLSPLMPSPVAFDGIRCADLRSACDESRANKLRRRRAEPRPHRGHRRAGLRARPRR